MIAKVKNNMKEKFINLFDKLMLRKRVIMETVIDQSKNISKIEHTSIIGKFFRQCRQAA